MLKNTYVRLILLVGPLHLKNTISFHSMLILSTVHDVLLVNAASRWKDAASGQHVEYDQRPDIFRFVYRACNLNNLGHTIQQHY